MADGQATKIIFPFEVSTLMAQAARFLGATGEGGGEGAVQPSSLPETDILGTIPSSDEIKEILREMDASVRTEISVEDLKDVSRARKKTGSDLVEEIENDSPRETDPSPFSITRKRCQPSQTAGTRWPFHMACKRAFRDRTGVAFLGRFQDQSFSTVILTRSPALTPWPFGTSMLNQRAPGWS